MVVNQELLAADPMLFPFLVQGQLGSSKTMNEELIRRMEADKIHPVIAKVFEWGEAKEAYAMLMTQKGVGKIVIKGVPASV